MKTAQTVQFFAPTDGSRIFLLSENVSLEDTLYFAVNHTHNYVDPITGAHTQSIEGTWNLCKNFLPSCGVKPKNLDSYLSAFMWFRYVKQRKLDTLKHFLTSAAFVFQPTVSVLPIATMTRTRKSMPIANKPINSDKKV